MAKVRKFEYVASNSSPHPTSTDAQWCVVPNLNSRLLQISTFGSETRANPAKMSQTLQFDRDMAIRLVRTVFEVFPDLPIGELLGNDGKVAKPIVDRTRSK